MPLYDGDRVVGPLPHRPQSDVCHLGRQRIGADNEHWRAGGQFGREQAGGGLRARDDVVGVGGEPEVAQMRGDVGRAARCIVGDEENACGDVRQRVDGTDSRLATAENGAIQVQ